MTFAKVGEDVVPRFSIRLMQYCKEIVFFPSTQRVYITLHGITRLKYTHLKWYIIIVKVRHVLPC